MYANATALLMDASLHYHLWCLLILEVRQERDAGVNMQLMLGHNELTGSLPFDLRLIPVSHLSVSHNNLVGDLFVTAVISNSFEFRLDHNRFSGALSVHLSCT